MQDGVRLAAASTGLVALVWESLERIYEMLPGTGSRAAPGARVDHELLLLRLELVGLSDCLERIPTDQGPAADQCRQMAGLVGALMARLDFDTATPTSIVRLRIAAAQDLLFDEVLKRGRGDYPCASVGIRMV